jgi:hypothetical protein
MYTVRAEYIIFVACSNFCLHRLGQLPVVVAVIARLPLALIYLRIFG